MNTPATPPISMQDALSKQMTALLSAANVVFDAPFSDQVAFKQIMKMETDVESVYEGYLNNAEVPDLTSDSQTDLQNALDTLQAAIDNSQATSQLILGAAELVAVFRGTAAPTPAPQPAPVEA